MKNADAPAVKREAEEEWGKKRKSSRYGHRDATMILIGYRHGLRASELCDLQWSQVELATGRLHVRRAKNGSGLRGCGQPGPVVEFKLPI